MFLNQLGIALTYHGAWNLWKKGMIPNSRQLPTGTIVIDNEGQTKTENIVIYARVSSSQNRNNLESQAKRLEEYCFAKGYHILNVVKEIDSGVNDKRKRLLDVLVDKKVTKIVVEHKDRLTRFGFNYLETMLNEKDVEIEVVNDAGTDKQDLMQDLISIITSMCARYYGLRRGRRKTEKIIKDLTDEKKV